jgi:abnormal spindle-like microcephaly-associated protein
MEVFHKKNVYYILGVVTTRDIVDGHREKTLSLLWAIILHYQVAMVINVEQVKEEVQILERSLRLKKQLHKFVNLQTGEFLV